VVLTNLGYSEILTGCIQISFGSDVPESSKFLDDVIFTYPPERPKSGIHGKLAGSSNNNLKESEDSRYNYIHIKDLLSYYTHIYSGV